MEEVLTHVSDVSLISRLLGSVHNLKLKAISLFLTIAVNDSLHTLLSRKEGVAESLLTTASVVCQNAHDHKAEMYAVRKGLLSNACPREFVE
jgi:ubiquinone biosynthesis protein UbiJ